MNGKERKDGRLGRYDPRQIRGHVQKCVTFDKFVDPTAVVTIISFIVVVVVVVVCVGTLAFFFLVNRRGRSITRIPLLATLSFRTHS